jgi:CSLREA domain-containing protein
MPPARLQRTLTSSPIHYLLGLSLIVIATTLLMTLTPLAQVRETAIVVNTLEDELNDGGGDCSLREAIEAANTDSSVDGCPAGDGDDAILLPAGNYLLALVGADEDANATGDLDIVAGNLILMGTGPERTIIDGNRLDRVLHIHSESMVEIHGVQITHGKTPDGYPGGVHIEGGGIRNDGTLLLSDSTVVSNNTGAGLEAYVDGGHGGGL